MAVSDQPGTATIYLDPGFSGLSSLNKEVVEKNLPSDLKPERITVNVPTLAEICQSYVVDKDVHFLKIDVEGLEKNVLQGNDWSQLRPWIVLVEATVPLSTVENHSAWEPLLLSANYTFAYAFSLEICGFTSAYLFDGNERCLGISELTERKLRDISTSKIRIYDKGWNYVKTFNLRNEGLVLDFVLLPGDGFFAADFSLDDVP